MLYDKAAKELIKPGVVGVIPTDTVYGIVAVAKDKLAVERLYKLKKRDKKPGTIIAASINQLEQIGIKHRYLKAVAEFWPGKVSVIIPTSDPNFSYLHQDTFSLALRIPDNKQLIELLNVTGPLLTTSANPPGEITAKNIAEAKKYFKADIDFYIDGGTIKSEPSTIVQIIDDAVNVVRAGAVKISK